MTLLDVISDIKSSQVSKFLLEEYFKYRWLFRLEEKGPLNLLQRLFNLYYHTSVFMNIFLFKPFKHLLLFVLIQSFYYIFLIVLLNLILLTYILKEVAAKHFQNCFHIFIILHFVFLHVNINFCYCGEMCMRNIQRLDELV